MLKLFGTCVLLRVRHKITFYIRLNDVLFQSILLQFLRTLKYCQHRINNNQNRSICPQSHIQKNTHQSPTFAWTVTVSADKQMVLCVASSVRWVAFYNEDCSPNLHTHSSHLQAPPCAKRAEQSKRCAAWHGSEWAEDGQTAIKCTPERVATGDWIFMDKLQGRR